MTDFLNYKFRCHTLGNFLTDPVAKADPLSKTTLSFLREEWIKVVYGREKILSNKYLDKGVQVESDSLDLVKEVTGEKYFKNQKELSNEHIIGIPDVIEKEEIIDIKSSWDIWTFASVDEKKAKNDYYGQILGYMMLLGVKKARLMYCLVNTPEEIINDEMYKASYKNPELSTSNEAAKEFRKNYIFDDIPAKDRLKVFEFEYDEEVADKLINRIIASRYVMNTMSL